MARFRRIFGSSNSQEPHYFACGNHDVGIGPFVVKEAYDRFKKVFGNPNFKIDFKTGDGDGWEVVVIDSQSFL